MAFCCIIICIILYLIQYIVISLQSAKPFCPLQFLNTNNVQAVMKSSQSTIPFKTNWRKLTGMHCTFFLCICFHISHCYCVHTCELILPCTVYPTCRAKPCTYFKQGDGVCPFGNSCFYLHGQSACSVAVCTQTFVNNTNQLFFIPLCD